ncbi:MAG: hypothetical protein WBQ36_07890 [Desulfobaccales bacterium]
MAQRFSEIGDLVSTLLDAIPSPIFVVDDDIQIIGYNLTASQMVALNPELVIRRRAGDILHCLHSTEVPAGCGRAQPCQECPVRNSVNLSVQGHRVVRKKARMELIREGRTEPVYLLVTTVPFTYQEKGLIILTLEDISELIALKNVVPICAHCKNIRNDQEYWQGVEKYFKEQLDLDFTHGICPDCARKIYPDFYEDRRDLQKERAQPWASLE